MLTESIFSFRAYAWFAAENKLNFHKLIDFSISYSEWISLKDTSLIASSYDRNDFCENDKTKPTLGQ